MQGLGQRQRVHPVTILTPVRRLWGLWLALTWPGARGNPIVLAPLLRLSFIHFAHWSLVRRMPARGGRRLPHDYVLFHSNFDGDLEQYIDAFAEVVPGRMSLVWAGAYGWTGPKPVGRFKQLIRSQALVEQDHHFFAAYPEASSRTVQAALRLRERAQKLARETGDLGDEAFAAAWKRFTVEAQEWL